MPGTESRRVRSANIQSVKARDVPDNASKIAEIETILESGATYVLVDGVATSLDHASLRKELTRLRAEDDAQRGRRPRAASIDLSNLF